MEQRTVEQDECIAIQCSLASKLNWLCFFKSAFREMLIPKVGVQSWSQQSITDRSRTKKPRQMKKMQGKLIRKFSYMYS